MTNFEAAAAAAAVETNPPDMDSYADRLIEHYHRSLCSSLLRSRRLEEGRLETLPPDFRVLAFALNPVQNIYTTCCMSQPEDMFRLELHLIARKQPNHEQDIVVLLHPVASFHRTGAPLGLEHTVNFGQPWQPGSACSHGFISLPYLFGETLEWLDDGQGGVRFLWLIPITPAELELKKREGSAALEDRFEECQFQYDDPLRPSVA